MQVPDSSEVMNEPSHDDEDGVGFSAADEPVDDKPQNEKSERQGIEEERKQLTELSQKELNKVELTIKIILDCATVL